MPWWLLMIVVFLAWVCWAFATVIQSRVRAASLGLKPHGVSLAPIVPVAPALFFAVGVLMDWLVWPWGSWLIGGSHGLLAVVSMGSFVHSLVRMRRIAK